MTGEEIGRLARLSLLAWTMPGDRIVAELVAAVGPEAAADRLAVGWRDDAAGWLATARKRGLRLLVPGDGE